MQKNRFYFVILLLVLVSTSCQKKHEKNMDVLKLNFQEGDLPSLHPHELMIYLRGLSLAKTLYEGLTRINVLGKAELAEAKTVTISEDKLRYTFVLKENQWSDGTPVTAYQYEQAFKEALAPNSSCPRADILYVLKNGKEAKKGNVPIDSVGVKAKDAKTLILDLEFPSPFLLELLAQPIAFPLANVKIKEPTLFNGPFFVKNWCKGDSLSLKPNPHYWDTKNVSLKEIIVFMAQDQETAFSLFEKKEIDWIGVPLCNLSTEQIHFLKDRGTLKSHPIDRAFWIYLNTQHPSLRSSKIRQALSLSLDRRAITQHIFAGGLPLDKPLPFKLLPTETATKVSENVLLAKEKFVQGLNELGYTKETLPPIEIMYSSQANRKKCAEYLQQAWTQAFGIKVVLQEQEWNVLRSNLGKGLFAVSGCYEAAYYNDPLELLERMTVLGPGNFSQWTNLKFGEKIALALQETHEEKRMKYLAEAEEILIEEMPFIPISSDIFQFEHHPRLRNYAFDSVGAIDFSRATFR